MSTAIIGVLIGVFCGILVAASSYTIGRIHERDSIREVYHAARDRAESGESPE